MQGLDYATFPHPAVTAIKAAGYGFVMRYTSPSSANDTDGKNLLPGELKTLLDAGLKVGVVFEYAAQQMLGGHAQGVTDAQHSDAVVKALGMPGLPVYFAADWDATVADQTPINAYLDGVASVIGLKRTGIYGGYYPVRRALDAGKATWAWQTLAWSGGQWDSRAHIRQYLGVTVGGVACDLDESVKADFGQWPRPAAPVTDWSSMSATPWLMGNFAWPAVPGAIDYDLEAEDASGLLTAQWQGTGTHAQNVRLGKPGSYRWHVRASGQAWSPWKTIEG